MTDRKLTDEKIKKGDQYRKSYYITGYLKTQEMLRNGLKLGCVEERKKASPEAQNGSLYHYWTE
jgi:hypothetical protein